MERTHRKASSGGFHGTGRGFGRGLSPEVLALLVKRRAVIEAAAAKVGKLRDLIEEAGETRVRHTLVYCSDKRPEQLIASTER